MIMNLSNIGIIVIITIISVSAAMLWRTCIYTRGAIFRPVGRLLDKWVDNGCLPTATLRDKVLRFIAYPLGRCIYCSSIHFGYNTFFIVNYLFALSMSIKWLFVLIPLVHLFTVIFVKSIIHNNNDLEKDDWDYMQNSKQLLDLKKRANKWEPKAKVLDTPLTKEEEDILERAKAGNN